MNQDVRSLIAQYLEEQKLMQLCTVNNGNPWACSVWQAADSDLNIYFFSWPERRHSIEIEQDERVAGALALPFTPEDPKPRGLQFEGTAKRLTAQEDTVRARSLYQDRIFPAETIDNFINHKVKPHDFYKIEVSRYVLFDTENFPDASRQEYVPGE